MNRLVVRTITVIEILDENVYHGVENERIRTTSLSNLISNDIFGRTQSFRIETSTQVIKEDNEHGEAKHTSET